MPKYQLMPDERNSTTDDLRWKVVLMKGFIESNAETVKDNLTEDEAKELIRQLPSPGDEA